ncbi:ZZ-type zinc finger-containing protein 3 isoform X2 [Monodelphis domestica]|uniref:ZZ-type zinc finger-containing protein 3 isoform X2 n=1 Tax=Monodelphis domestica TaxID=13616 RepID=UPI0024E222D7|nr:ZZ-type zinc finger-containing protein 3 isoform X2 [Monodelphis domestica]
MAASRSTRVTRSTVGLNGLDETFCGRTLRNRSIAHPEEGSPHCPVRARSPKKRPELAQTLKGHGGGRSADPRQPGARELWVSPRKRGLSSSERDNAERLAPDGCERRPAEAASPILKRLKRCLRSEAPSSSEEESPPKAEQEGSPERAHSVLDHGADAPGAKRACRCLLLDDCEKREIKKANARGDGSPEAAAAPEAAAYEALNGVDGSDAALPHCDDCRLLDGSPSQSLPASCVLQDQPVAENGDPGARPSPCRPESRREEAAVDQNVPCPESPGQAEPEEPSLGAARPRQEPTPLPLPDSQPALRDSEEEVDVVGEGASREQLAPDNPDGAARAGRARAPVPGEPAAAPSPDCVPAALSSLSEPQEHRYTLRTSPRRAAPSKGSPTKNTSPCRENGQMDEERLSPAETSVPLGAPRSGSPADSEEAVLTGKGMSRDPGSPPSEARLPPGYGAPAKESAAPRAPEDDEEEPDVYYFESDHVALKHNKDYQRLLQTIAVLEAQRTQAVQDLESLGRHQREALKNPIGFVEKLQKKRVVQLPEVAWDQYTHSLGNFEREFRNRQRHSRRVKLVFDKVGLPARPRSPSEPRKDGEAFYSVLPFSDAPEGCSSRPQMIRGRLCDETKPETFNQLWTVEEQKKLEQLLLKYPPEEVESRRWQKIADELGNRTAKQVASRVQKYFIKLTKAGIPVPGRTPNLYMYSKKSSTSRRQHPLNKHLFKPSTFMTSHEPPVYMDEGDDGAAFHGHSDPAAEEASDEESIPVSHRGFPEYKELLELKKLKKQKLQQMQAESGFVQHAGFKCDNCGMEPIQGIRWHCQDCPQDVSLDFCDSCSDCLHETDLHKEDHQLEPVYRAETFLDRDYCVPQGASYSYLDPNYFPANR